MGARRKQRPFFPVSPIAKEPPHKVHNPQVMSHQRVIGRPVERADFGQCSGQSPFARTDAFAKGDMGGDEMAQPSRRIVLFQRLCRHPFHQGERFVIDRDDELFLAGKIIGHAGRIQPDGLCNIRKRRCLHARIIDQDRRRIDDGIAFFPELAGVGCAAHETKMRMAMPSTLFPGDVGRLLHRCCLPSESRNR